MSDPLKNAEIEDVLSSIRRLVSENHSDPEPPKAQEPAAPKAAPAEPETARASDRLVLTPSLRIEDEPEAKPVEQTSPLADTPFVNSLKEDLLPLRENLPSFLQKSAEVEEAVDVGEVSSDETELTADISEETQLSAVENTVQFPAPDELKFETARTERGVTEPDEDARPWEIEGERLSEWNSVRANHNDSFEPDGPEDGANAGTSVASLNWEDHEVSEDVAPTKPVKEPVDPVAERITETVFEEVAAADATIDAQQYDAVLDEEMLRELVGEIVRQELQGPLGERITRNVRKLVRREINRALTARSFNDG